jgi:two-component system phosphate regulon sensor histidine kinase PhoR
VVIGRIRRGKDGNEPERDAMAVAAERGRYLIEESPEIVLVLDDHDVVVAASRRARDLNADIVEGYRVPAALLREDAERMPVIVPYVVNGRRERLVYLSSRAGELAAYEELRAGFTAAVSHELRTPLARLLILLESADLPGADSKELLAQAQAEVGQIGELIDDVLFLSELETGREVVALGSTPVCGVLRDLAAELGDRAARAGMRIEIECDESLELPLRPRMLRVLVSNLIENALRYAGEGATFTLAVRRTDDATLLVGSDDGPGVAEDDLPRLFERFYRADRARSTRGTGLGLAIVKHIVVSAGGHVDASATPGGGLTVTCAFPLPV